MSEPFSENITQKIPLNVRKALTIKSQKVFNHITIKEARSSRDTVIEDYKNVAENAMKRMIEKLEDAITVMVFPRYLQKYC